MAQPSPGTYANFERIPAEEQRRILEACIEVFSQNGYEAASTNTIVSRAGIPKGTLFYYFGSKKNLYLYVIDHAVKRFAAALKPAADKPAGDVFERLLQSGEARMKFMIQEPRLYQLFFNAFINAPEEIRSELQARYAGYYQTSARRMLDGLDRSRFREDIQVEKAIELINLLLEGLFNHYLPVFQHLSPAEALALVGKLSAETEMYFEMLKKGVYKDA